MNLNSNLLMKNGFGLFWVLIMTAFFAACPEPEENLPALTGTVSISGDAQVGQTLTANTGSLGGNGVISYQWIRDDGAVIGGSSTYAVQDDDVGFCIAVTVTRAGNSGSVTSNWTATIANVLQGTEGLAYELIKGNSEYRVSLGAAIALGEIVIPATYNGLSVTAIADNAFSNCSNMTSIIIPNSVTDIGTNALSGCTGLTSITIPFTGASLNGTTNTHFGYIFGATSSDSQNSSIPSSLTTVIITGGNSIGSYAFVGCSGLASITIPSGVTSIGVGTFNECSGLTSITIPSSVTSIGDGAFYNCSGLTSITIPSSVTSIGFMAFYNCSGLERVFYGGVDSATWNGITIYSYNTPLTNAVRYYYSETHPGTANTHWRWVDGEPSVWE